MVRNHSGEKVEKMAELTYDELIRSRRKTVTLIITKDAKLQVRAPLKLPINVINKIVKEKENWITKNKSLALNKLEHTKSLTDKTKSSLLFLGTLYTPVPFENTKTILIENRYIYIPKEKYGNYEFIEKWYKKQAAVILKKRLDEISKNIGISFQGCSITSARKRWGSCNAKNHINLSWRLIFADYKYIDYVIVHELCHVVHKNHSAAYWSFLKSLMPEYNILRKWLKDNSYILDLF